MKINKNGTPTNESSNFLFYFSKKIQKCQISYYKKIILKSELPNLPSHLYFNLNPQKLKTSFPLTKPASLSLFLSQKLSFQFHTHNSASLTHAHNSKVLSLSKFASYFSNSLLKFGQILSSGKLFRFPYHC